MFRLGADLNVYLHREPIDFRAGINSLAVLVQEVMELDPFAPAVFAFCNRRRDRMKLLFFDRSGFVMVLKRLTEDRFRWPRRETTVVTLTTEQLHCWGGRPPNGIETCQSESLQISDEGAVHGKDYPHRWIRQRMSFNCME